MLANLARRRRRAQSLYALFKDLRGTLTERMGGPQMQRRDARARSLEDGPALLPRMFERWLHLPFAFCYRRARSLFRREKAIHRSRDL